MSCSRFNRRRAAAVVAAAFSLTLHAGAPLWPVPGGTPPPERPHAEFVQPTASGEPDSGLFGCVRNNGNRFHEGLDLAPVLPRRRGEAVDPVTAIHDGVVVHVNDRPGDSSYGRYVVLEHPQLDLAIYTLYAHLASVTPGLAPGRRVKAGEPLGVMGRTAGGYAIPRERAHLHLETGLRLGGDFDAWYRRQRYETPNRHGNFNGLNLRGWDPLDYFRAFHDGRADSPLAYLLQLPPGLVIHFKTDRYPEFLRRHPALELAGCAEPERAGWEITLAAWGLPLAFKPLRADQLNGPRQPGEAAVVAVNAAALQEFQCRQITRRQGKAVRLGSGGRQVLELLFGTVLEAPGEARGAQAGAEEPG